MAQQIEGVFDSIHTWMKANNITLSDDAVDKLELNGFNTIEDLQYCSVEDMDVHAKQEMHIKLADRIKLKKAMQILTDNHTKASRPSQVITLMGHKEITPKDTVNEAEMVAMEGASVTILGQPECDEKKADANGADEDLFIGNLHKTSKYVYISGKTSHTWTLFISASKDKLVNPQSIKQVTYYLHSSFTPSIFTIKDTPFVLKKTGWGSFGIKAKIEFYEKSNREKMFCAHLLDFDHNVTLTHIDEHSSLVIDETVSNVIDCADFYDENVDVHHPKADDWVY
eukprot:639023_1